MGYDFLHKEAPFTQQVKGLSIFGQIGWDMNLTIYIHLVTKSRMSGDIPPLPLMLL
jgi:hypothetical protein